MASGRVPKASSILLRLLIFVPALSESGALRHRENCDHSATGSRLSPLRMPVAMLERLFRGEHSLREESRPSTRGCSLQAHAILIRD